MSAIESTFETFFSFFHDSSANEQKHLECISKNIDKQLYGPNKKRVVRRQISGQSTKVWHPASDAVKTMKYLGMNPTDF